MFRTNSFNSIVIDKKPKRSQQMEGNNNRSERVLKGRGIYIARKPNKELMLEYILKRKLNSAFLIVNAHLYLKQKSSILAKQGSSSYIDPKPALGFNKTIFRWNTKHWVQQKKKELLGCIDRNGTGKKMHQRTNRQRTECLYYYHLFCIILYFSSHSFTIILSIFIFLSGLYIHFALLCIHLIPLISTF